MNEERVSALVKRGIPKSVAYRLAVQTEDMDDDDFQQFAERRKVPMGTYTVSRKVRP